MHFGYIVSVPPSVRVVGAPSPLSFHGFLEVASNFLFLDYCGWCAPIVYSCWQNFSVMPILPQSVSVHREFVYNYSEWVIECYFKNSDSGYCHHHCFNIHSSILVWVRHIFLWLDALPDVLKQYLYCFLMFYYFIVLVTFVSFSFRV